VSVTGGIGGKKIRIKDVANLDDEDKYEEE